MTCPSFEKLIDHLDGRLQPDAADAVAAHLCSGCKQCVTDQKWYESVIRMTAVEDSAEPQTWVIKRAIRLFDGTRSSSGLAGRLGEIVATLVFDSLKGPALAGTRGTESAEHQLLYRAEDFNIDLLLTSRDRRGNLRGQILREYEFQFESTARIGIELVGDGERAYSAETDGFGEFSIAAIDAGLYDLRVKLGEVTITVVGLAI
jgi:hypothetical protein